MWKTTPIVTTIKAASRPWFDTQTTMNHSGGPATRRTLTTQLPIRHGPKKTTIASPTSRHSQRPTGVDTRYAPTTSGQLFKPTCHPVETNGHPLQTTSHLLKTTG